MPKSSFSLETEVNYYSHVLVVDEVGGLATLLVDALLQYGCLINYFGKEKEESFYYLQGKDNFHFITTKSAIEEIGKLDYLFYFPADSSSDNNQTIDVWQIAEKHQSKLLIAASVENQQNEKLSRRVKDKKINARLAVFDHLFGPRIKTGPLGKLFYNGLKNQAIISLSPEEKIFPLSVKSLVGELIKLIFSPDSRGNCYLLEGREVKISKFVEMAHRHFPLLKVDFLENQRPQKNLSGFKKLVLEENLEERIKETGDWFSRHLLTEDQSKEEKVKEKNTEEREEKLLDNWNSQKKDLVLEEPKDASSSGNELGFIFSPAQTPDNSADNQTKEEKEAVSSLAEREDKKPLKKKNKQKSSLLIKSLFGSCFFALLLFCFFALPLLFSAASGMMGVRQLVQVKKAVEVGDFSLALQKSKAARKYLSISQKTVSVSGPFYALIGLEGEIEQVSEVFHFCQSVNDSLSFALISGQELANLANSFVRGESARWEESLGEIKANLSFAYEQASLAQSSLQSTEKGFEFLKQKEAYEKLRSYLPESRELLLKGQSLLAVLPEIIGLNGRKTYLILFQNNMELRPTGGFIGSYALANLEAGKLVNFEVFDVYQADGQLKGHVEPPAKLKEYLGEANWYLRDSNWDPNFVVSAKRAEWFLDKEMQVSVDGTIAVTLQTAQKILSALGGVMIPEYEEEITADNLFEKAEYYSELATFPGSTQKKDFLGSLSRALFEKIKGAKDKQLINVAGALFTSLEEKEMLLYFNKEEVESVITALGWEGGIRNFQPQTTSQSVFVDYLHLNEANVGVNKANYFLTRQINHEISLSPEGRVREKLVLLYENQSPSNTWPAGTYQAYLRLYLPKGTKTVSVLATDPGDINLWLPYDARLLDSTEKDGKSVLGIFLEVPIQKKRLFEISYELAGRLDLNQKLNPYLLLLQKQPGAHPSEYELTFSYPQGLVPVRVIPSAIMGQDKLLVTSRLTEDKIFQIDLAH